VVNAADNSLSVFLADGRGGLVRRQDLVVGKRPFAVALGDLNGDGKADLVTANSLDNDITVLLSK
jgi:hypothetical protein